MFQPVDPSLSLQLLRIAVGREVPCVCVWRHCGLVFACSGKLDCVDTDIDVLCMRSVFGCYFRNGHVLKWFDVENGVIPLGPC